MRRCNEFFDVLEEIRNLPAYNKWLKECLCLPHEKVFELKSEYENSIKKYGRRQVEELTEFVPWYEQEKARPLSQALYDINLEYSAFFSFLLDYKYTNLAIYKSKNRLKTEAECKKVDKPIRDLIINTIKSKPNVSYFELIDLKSEDEEIEVYLEEMIEEGVLYRRGKPGAKFWGIRVDLE